MSIAALLIIAALVTALLIKARRPLPALVAGLVTGCLLFAAIPTLAPAVASSTAEFARQLGAATARAANIEGTTP